MSILNIEEAETVVVVTLTNPREGKGDISINNLSLWNSRNVNFIQIITCVVCAYT